jgi:aminoglycoside N3'-acetyltransferase
MPVIETSRAEFAEHLDRLGIYPGMHLAVHARLMTFGRVEDGAAGVFQALRGRLGRKGTLAFPTFTLHLGPDDVYDPAATPSRAMGALSEYARQSPGTRRSLCPLHNFAVIGAEAEGVLASDLRCSLGRASCFDAMAKAGFHIVLLGCSFQEGATFAHHAEANVGVPYREWVELPRRVRDGEEIRSIRCRHYGRRTGEPWETDLRRLEASVLRDPRTRSSPIGRRFSALVPMSVIEEHVAALLDDDPYALMRSTTEEVHDAVG